MSFDDGFFPEFKGQVLVVGIIMRGKEVLENAVSTKITVDGVDSTTKLVKLVNSTPQKPNAIFLDGIAFGGFNIIDLTKLNKKTGIPVVSITRKKPDIEKIRKAIQKTPNPTKKLRILKSNGPLHEHKKLRFHCKGITEQKAKQLINTTTKNTVPEGLRIAHIIASGVTRSV